MGETYEQLQTDVDTLSRQRNEVTRERDTVVKGLARTIKERDEARAEVERFQGEMRRANDRINELGRERDEMRKERDHAQEEFADKQAVLSLADETIEILTEERDEAWAEVELLRKDGYVLGHREDEVAGWRQRVQQDAQKLGEMRKDRDHLIEESKFLRKARDEALALVRKMTAEESTRLDGAADLSSVSAGETTYATYARVVDGDTVRLDTETDITSGEETAVEQVHTLTSRVIDAIERRTKCQGVDPEQVSIRGYFVNGGLQWRVSTMGWRAAAAASLEQAFDNLIQLILEDRK